jgi:hypothetical protein
MRCAAIEKGFTARGGKVIRARESVKVPDGKDGV